MMRSMNPEDGQRGRRTKRSLALCGFLWCLLALAPMVEVCGVQQQAEGRLNSEERVGIIYMLTKSSTTAMLLVRDYPQVSSAQRGAVLSRIEDELLAAQALLGTLQGDPSYETLPTRSLGERLQRVRGLIGASPLPVEAIDAEFRSLLLGIATWMEGDARGVEDLIGFNMGLALPAIVRELGGLLAGRPPSNARLEETAGMLGAVGQMLLSLELLPALARELQGLRDLLTDSPEPREGIELAQRAAQGADAFLQAVATVGLTRHSAERRARPEEIGRKAREFSVVVLPATEDPAAHWLEVGMANEIALLLRSGQLFARVLAPMEYAPVLLTGGDPQRSVITWAAQQGATHALLVSLVEESEVLEFGWEFSNLRTGEVIARGVLEEDAAQRQHAPWRLSENIAEELSQRIRVVRTTASVEAFDLNLRGVGTWYDLFARVDAGAENMYEAADLFRRALAADPQYPNCTYNLGLLYLHIGDERSLNVLSQALSAGSPVDLQLIASVGSAVSGDESIRQAMRADRDNPPLILLETATWYYRAAIIGNSLNAFHHARLASALGHLERHEDSVPVAETAVALFPFDGLLYEQLGSQLLSLASDDPDRRPAAVAAMEEAIRIGPLDCELRQSAFLGCVPRAFFMAELAVAYAGWGDWTLALQWAEKALADEDLAHAEDTVRAVINDEIAQRAREAGREAQNDGDLRRALEYFEYALAAAELLGDEDRMSVELGNIAVLHRRFGDLQQALVLYERARELSDRPSQQVVLLHNVAVLRFLLGDLHAAEEALWLAEEMLPFVADRDAARLQGMIWARRAEGAFNQGEILEAFTLIDRAITTTPDEDLRLMYLVHKANMLRMAGLAHEALELLSELQEQLPAAQDSEVVGMYARTLMGLVEYGATLPAGLVEFAVRHTWDVLAKVDLLLTLAVAMDETGRHDEARASIVEAMSIAPPGKVAEVEGTLGFHLLRQGEYRGADEVFQEAICRLATCPPHGDPSGLPEVESVFPYPDLGVSLYWGRAHALQGVAREEPVSATRRELYAEAARSFDVALELLDEVRSGARTEVYTSALLGGHRGLLFEHSLAHLLEWEEQYPGSVNPLRTLVVAEQARARTTADMLYSLALNPYLLVVKDAEAAGLLHRLSLKISELSTELARESGKPEGERKEALVGAISDELTRAQRDFQSLWDDLVAGESADYFTTDVDLLTESVERALGYLSLDEALLSFYVTNDGIYLWVAAWDQDAQEHRVGVPLFVEYPRPELLEDVIALRTLLETQRPTVRESIRLEGLLERLYETLVQPGLDVIPEGVGTLLIVPSGPLWYVPFAGLMMIDQEPIAVDSWTERRPYLVELYTIVHLPSLATLGMLLEREAPEPRARLLALADPELTAEQIEALRMEDRQIYFEQLRDAAREFAHCFAGEERDVHTGEEAHEALAHGESMGFQVLVYAAHGQFNLNAPLNSRLLLAAATEQPAPTAEEPRVADGYYHAWEVFLTDHRGVELVVLAACESLLPALSDLQKKEAELSGRPAGEGVLSLEHLEQIVAGDEVVGLVRAFLSSGAQSVLGTLWQANPGAIAMLLASACGHYQVGLSWARALREAQLELITDASFAEPWFWATFQLIGRWR